MAAKRNGRNLMICFGLMTLPACVFVRPSSPVVPGVSDPVPQFRPNPSATHVSDFASLVRVPGSRISTTAAATSPPPANPSATSPAVESSPPASSSVVQNQLSGYSAAFDRENAFPIGTEAPSGAWPPRGLPALLPLAEAAAPEPPLLAAVRAYVNNQPEQAVAHLKALPPPNQELMLQLIPAVVLASQLDWQRCGPTELGMLAEQLREPADRLASRGPLILDRVCFCRRVKNFGRYDPLPPDHRFQRGALAELYVEVRNAPSVATIDPQQGSGYVTRLVCTLQVVDARGSVVPIIDRNLNRVATLTETKVDFTRSPIRDYFLLFRFPVPDRSGNYAVTIKVHDPAGGREVSQTLPNLRVQ